MKAVALQA